jgi:hypothetical protein
MDDRNMEGALEALAKHIAQWTGKGDQVVTGIPG